MYVNMPHIVFEYFKDWGGSMIVRERIEIRVDVETKQLAERAAVHRVVLH